MEKPLNSALTPGPSRSGRGENKKIFQQPTVVFYTANLRGDLELLPRLYTFIRQLKAQPVDLENDVMLCIVEPVNVRTLLLDLGNSCAADVWHCAVTGGRSTLVALDAMGYHAANVAGFLTAEGRAKLENDVSVALIDHAHTWQDGDVFITNGTRRGEPPSRPYSLHIVLAPATSTRVEGDTLYLAAVNAGQVGMAQISAAGVLLAHDVFDMPPGTQPDATIAATVDFVLSEARFLQRKQG